MAKISGFGSDTIPLFRMQGLDPSATHNHLRLFLRDDFRFRTPQLMCSFATLLLNASAFNKSWVSIAQNFDVLLLLNSLFDSQMKRDK